MSNVVLITGASSGIGRSAAKLLKEQGCKVYGAARRINEMKDLTDLGIQVIELDLTVDASIVGCVEQILKKEERIDILINNAGYGSYGSVEDMPIDEARRQFEVNIFGLARLTQLVLPGMREVKKGRIVNISSMAGKVYTPMGAWYHATKHALEGLSDCLRLETKAFGVDVVIVQPGGIKTEWGTIAAENLRKVSGKGAYAAMANKVAGYLEESYRGDTLTAVEVLGKVVADAATVKRPKRRYVKGYMASFSMISRKFLGDRIFDKAVISIMK